MPDTEAGWRKKRAPSERLEMAWVAISVSVVPSDVKCPCIVLLLLQAYCSGIPFKYTVQAYSSIFSSMPCRRDQGYRAPSFPISQYSTDDRKPPTSPPLPSLTPVLPTCTTEVRVRGRVRIRVAPRKTSQGKVKTSSPVSRAPMDSEARPQPRPASLPPLPHPSSRTHSSRVAATQYTTYRVHP